MLPSRQHTSRLMRVSVCSPRYGVCTSDSSPAAALLLLCCCFAAASLHTSRLKRGPALFRKVRRTHIRDS